MKTFMRHRHPRRRALVAFAAALSMIARLPAVPSSEIDITIGCAAPGCHADKSEGKFLHGPVNLGECAPCHVAEGNKHVFKKSESPRDTCLICHDMQGAMPVVHEPFATDCTACHDPHQSDNRYFVMGGTGADGCNRCHGDVREGQAHLHGPVAAGECLVCHTPHQSQNAKLLVEARPQLCLGCHTDVAESTAQAVSTHKPVMDDCSGCHQPHGGPTPFFLPTEGRELCQQCHGDFLEKASNFKFSHEAMTQGQSCLNCHAPHSSKQASLLAEEVGDLCLNCHNRPIEAEGRTLDNIAVQLTSSKYLHGPLRENNCAACHEAHGSDSSRILNKEFPEKFYTEFAPDKYDLCFECHDRRIITEEATAATAFRNGDRNLHFLHVDRDKGRSCRACHHEHASNQPHHIRDEVDFGRWSMKIEYSPTETGGGCMTGCHLPYRYDRDNAVVNKTEPVQ